MSIQEEIIKEMRSLGYTEEQLNNLSMADGCQTTILSSINETLIISEKFLQLIRIQLKNLNTIRAGFENIINSRNKFIKKFKSKGDVL